MNARSMFLALGTLVATAAVGCGGGENPGTTGDGGGLDGAVMRPDGAACATGLVACGMLCVDVSADPAHCGGCGRDCDPGATCTSGVCGCPSGTMDCGGGCTTGLMTDPLNCGTCGNECAAGASCAAGVCECASGLVACGRECVDVSSDPGHCGGCGNDCPSGVCTSGTCACPAPLLMAGGSCVDPTRDPQNCGSAGNTCGDLEYCVDSACVCRPGLTDVGGSCRDLSSDPMNCGTPGTVCMGGAALCSGGVCVADCGGGLDRCGSACVDRDTDPRNCGDCGNSCDVEQICSNGECRDFRPAIACTTCPCDTSCNGDFRTCCMYPGRASDLICVDGDCP